MWWDDDSWVSRLIPNLVEASREGQLPFVTVIGSTWTRNGERTLFVGVDPAFDPRPAQWIPDDRIRDRLGRAALRRLGPLPYPEELPRSFELPEEGEVITRVAAPPLRSVVTQHLAVRLGLRQIEQDPVRLPLHAADPETREQLERYEVPPETQIGYLAPIRLLARRGISMFRLPSRKRATAGCLLETDSGLFLTTVGHLDASKGDTVYRRVSLLPGNKQWEEWGRVFATTSPEHPDGSTSATGLDLTAVLTEARPDGVTWESLELGNPRQLVFEEYVRWNGGRSGQREGNITITAAMAKAEENLKYEHALLVLGKPPRLGGRKGDSGTAIYDSEGRLLGHLVGTQGGILRGSAPAVWFQMIDVAHPYLEEMCGPIHNYYGDRGH